MKKGQCPEFHSYFFGGRSLGTILHNILHKKGQGIIITLKKIFKMGFETFTLSPPLSRVNNKLRDVRDECNYDYIFTNANCQIL